MNKVGREKGYDKWLKVRQQFAEAYQTRQPSAEASTYSDSASNDSKIRYFTLLPCPLDPVFSQYELYMSLCKGVDATSQVRICKSLPIVLTCFIHKNLDIISCIFQNYRRLYCP